MTQSSFEELPPEVAEQWRLLHEEAKGRYKDLAPSHSYVLPSIIFVALLVLVFGSLAANMLIGGTVTAADATATQEAAETAHAQRCKEQSAYQITFGNDGNPHREPPSSTLIGESLPEVSATWVMTNSSQIGCVWEDVKVQPLLGGEVIIPTLLLYPNKVSAQKVEPGQAVDLKITIPATDATSTPPIQWVLIVNGVPLFGDEEQYLTVKVPWIIP